jgi:uncharacterized protein (TIGR00661 family)
VVNALQKLKHIQFHVFSKKVKGIETHGNVQLIPVSNKAFTRSMISSEGVITGAGFETPAETLYLGKKLMCLPIQGQYEQLCNAEALKNFNVPIIDSIGNTFAEQVNQWLQAESPKPLQLKHSTAEIVRHVVEKGLELNSQKKHLDMGNLLQPEDVFAWNAGLA